ncbi:hypothetical protein NEDG_01921 [Nematocida displodere]|uniref:RING-type domain-containing protein n=1 Tax=Nematocida displodere TaxID=1805483 RepID=A0A177EGR6_9MICR|nr:hypothetical protein NEDG_01921 [Nematocida displodere]
MAHKKTRKLMLPFLALAPFVLANTGPNAECCYLSPEHTLQNIAFFRASGTSLEIKPDCNPALPIIASKQREPITIHLNSYTSKTIPDRLARGIQFSHLTIVVPVNVAQTAPDAPTAKVFEKLFWALRTLHTLNLTIRGEAVMSTSTSQSMTGRMVHKFRIIAERAKIWGRPPTPPPTHSPTLTPPLSPTLTPPLSPTLTPPLTPPHSHSPPPPLPSPTPPLPSPPLQALPPSPHSPPLTPPLTPPHSHSHSHSHSPTPLTPTPTAFSTSTRILRLDTTHLKLNNLPEALAEWILARLDAHDCELGLSIDKSPSITALRFLDAFNPKALVYLSVHGADALASIDCAALTQLLVRDVFEVIKTQCPVGASEATLAAIASKAWATVRVPAGLWASLAPLIRAPFAVDTLCIDIGFNSSLDAFWNAACQERASVTSLVLKLTNNGKIPKSKQTIEALLKWIDKSFAHTEELEIADISSQITTSSFNYPFICVDPLLPELKRLYCRSFSGQALNLYSPRSTLWVEPDTYGYWALGAMVDEMEHISRENIISINGTTPKLLHPGSSMLLNPPCMRCRKTVRMIGAKFSKTRTYIVIVCPSHHVVCSACLPKLSQIKPADKPLCCPLCKAVIVDTGFNGMIKKYERAAVRFTIGPT